MSTRDESFLIGLIGHGVDSSLTPAMHEHEADAQGMRYLYRPIDLTRLPHAPTGISMLLEFGRDLGFNGFNITYPCKEIALEHVDSLSEEARQVGAVNTIRITDGEFIGDNTDVTGFATALRQKLTDCSMERIVQLGAGGAGSAVAYALLEHGAGRLDLIDLDEERAVKRAAELQAEFPNSIVAPQPPEDVPMLLADADGVVNATPVGLHGSGVPLDITLLAPRLWVADLVYRPLETELVRAARGQGCRVLDGGHLAVGQAVDAFRLFTGVEPDAERMGAHFLRLIAEGR